MEKVCVLMSTYNGSKYLREQLDSILNQRGVKVNILVRDDGSTDDTLKILKEYELKGKLGWYSGKNLLPARSFMDLIYKAPECDFYAFCDQDDIWLEDKLKIAITRLNKMDLACPLLYYGEPRIVDDNLKKLERNIKCYGIVKFEESLICSNAAGCTMVFNRALLSFLKREKVKKIIMHDAWVHKVCLAVRGKVIYDDDVHVLYRQHFNNVIGIETNLFLKIIKRIKRAKRRRGEKMETIKTLYDCYSSEMIQNHKRICLQIINYKKSFINKLLLLFNINIKQKSFLQSVLFRLEILFNIY